MEVWHDDTEHPRDDRRWLAALGIGVLLIWIIAAVVVQVTGVVGHG